MSETKEFPSDRADKFVVRFPEGMRDLIAEAAKSNNRSMNAEIVARLQQSFESIPYSEATLGLMATISRMEADIAEERLEGLSYLSELAACSAPLRETLAILEANKLDEDISDLDHLEKIVHKFNFSKDWLSEQREKIENRRKQAIEHAAFAEARLSGHNEASAIDPKHHLAQAKASIADAKYQQAQLHLLTVIELQGPNTPASKSAQKMLEKIEALIAGAQ